jgi:Meiotically Up-regulated Gene 113 (MUG113) protein
MAVYIVGPAMDNYCQNCSSRKCGPYKIGHSKDVEKRLVQLRTGSPVSLEIKAVLPGGEDVEKILHWIFKGRRSHGEWFNLNGEDIRLIMKLSEEGLLFKGNEPVLAETIIQYMEAELGSDIDRKLSAGEILLELKWPL